MFAARCFRTQGITFIYNLYSYSKPCRYNVPVVCKPGDGCELFGSRIVTGWVSNGGTGANVFNQVTNANLLAQEPSPGWFPMEGYEPFGSRIFHGCDRGFKCIDCMFSIWKMCARSCKILYSRTHVFTRCPTCKPGDGCELNSSRIVT
jgi:hypothetical protein